MKKLNYDKLKGLREKKQITQEEMGKRLNTTQSNYNKLEKGIKKINNLDTIESIAEALGMRPEKLLSVLKNEKEHKYVGIPEEEIMEVEQILKDNPIREDEFIFLSTEVLDIEKYDFKDYYSGINLKLFDDNTPFPLGYPEDIHVFTSPVIEIGFEKIGRKNVAGFWLGGKKLGILPSKYYKLINELMDDLRISRVVLISSEESISGFFDTYMKAIFISTNAIGKSISFNGHSFSPITLLTPEEAGAIDNEALNT